MNDKEFYAKLDATITELMKGVPKIVCDIGRLNDVCMEITKRKVEANKQEATIKFETEELKNQINELAKDYTLLYKIRDIDKPTMTNCVGKEILNKEEYKNYIVYDFILTSKKG